VAGRARARPDRKRSRPDPAGSPLSRGSSCLRAIADRSSPSRLRHRAVLIFARLPTRDRDFFRRKAATGRSLPSFRGGEPGGQAPQPGPQEQESTGKRTSPRQHPSHSTAARFRGYNYLCAAAARSGHSLHLKRSRPTLSHFWQ
jgi:hypothetical protein